MSVQLQARNATPQDLVAILQDQKAHKLDLVVPAVNMKSVDGLLVVKNAEAQLTETGVMPVNGIYRPTEVFDEGVAGKLGIPQNYVRRMRAERPDLYDQNVNGWLHGRKRRLSTGELETVYEPDDRAFLLRLFRGEDGGEGVARAMLSDKYGLSMDNLDMLIAVQKGIAASGVNVITRVTDLSERTMRIRFEAPDVNALAPGLLENYRSPFDGGGHKRAGYFDELRQQYGAHHIFSEKDAPVAFIGLDFRNSETGGGAYTLTPVIEMVRCTNGWVERKEGIRKVHIGARLAEGQVKPSMETLRRAGELVASETTDAVKQYLSKGYLEQLIAKRSEQARVPVTEVTETVPTICASLGFSPDEQKGVLDMFIASGQITAGGVANAVSAYAQTVEDPDRASEIEMKTVDALEAAAKR